MVISFMTPQGLTESVNRRRPDTSMAKTANNELQNITCKTKDRVTRTPLKTGGELSGLTPYNKTSFYNIREGLAHKTTVV